MKLLGKNTKTVKTEARYLKWRVRVMHLAPARLSGHEVCAGRSPGCTAACLNLSGKGVMGMVQRARVAKTQLYFEDHGRFMAMLHEELDQEERAAKRRGKRLAVRLNGTSDLNWEAVVRVHPGVQFYDYTKVWERYEKWLERPAGNYWLTWSASEMNARHSKRVLRWGWPGSVALVAEVGKGMAERLPEWARGQACVDGDVHDLRFMDQAPCVVLLRPKGPMAKRDKTGFVVRDERGWEA